MVPCLRVLPCGSFVGTTLPSDFLPAFLGPGVARSCTGAHVGLTARLGVTRHVPGSRHVGWVGCGGVGFLAWVISPLAAPFWGLLGGCSRLRDCPQTPLGHRASGVPRLPACPMASSAAPRGWKGLAGMAGDVSLPPGAAGEVQKALGLFGAQGGHQGVGGATLG